MRGCHREEGRRKKGEVPRTAYCASASLQRGKNFLVASEGRSVKGAAPGQEDWNDQREGKESKNSAVLHTMWMLYAMVPRWTITVH